jgi:hypothetical protein
VSCLLACIATAASLVELQLQYTHATLIVREQQGRSIAATAAAAAATAAATATTAATAADDAATAVACLYVRKPVDTTVLRSPTSASSITSIITNSITIIITIIITVASHLSHPNRLQC